MWFDDTYIGWQEFIPTLGNVTSVEVFIMRLGNPGNITVELKTTGGTTLAQKTIIQADVSANDWVKAEFGTPVPVIPGTKYRIYVSSDTDSPTAANRYNWRCNSASTYCDTCDNNLPSGYDYAFRTYGTLYTTYLPIVIK
jgi:hypothetical protein